MKFSKFNQPKKNRKKVINKHSKEYIERMNSEAAKLIYNATSDTEKDAIRTALNISLNY